MNAITVTAHVKPDTVTDVRDLNTSDRVAVSLVGADQAIDITLLGDRVDVARVLYEVLARLGVAVPG